MFTKSEAGKLGYAKTQNHLEHFREKQQAVAKAAYELNRPHCVYCNAMLPYEKRRHKFCDHSCAASASNTGVTRNPKRLNRRTHCLKCGDLISGSGLLYCSTRCSHAHKSEKFESKFLSNSLDAGSNSSKAIRKFLIKTHGERCQECGWAKKHPMTESVPLELHHIDGDASNNCKENIQLLCPNCHSLTPTFRNLNKGRGRAYRKTTPK